MPKEPITNEEAIIEAADRLKRALLADLKATKLQEDIAIEKKKTHREVVEAQKYLWTIDQSLEVGVTLPK